ncbi:MAG: UvrD-helicase domain-containing protein, partial [Solirubrobacteraceae bacterium]
TNKAASEMRDRAELLVGRRVRAMWVMTFHAACARMLRAEAARLGYTRRFTIYDTADQRRLIKRILDEHGIDPKRFTPAAIGSQISDAKNKLRDADAYAQLVGSFFEQTVADVYSAYERELHRMNAMDFDDLLVRAVNVLELFQEVRDQYAGTFRHVLVDEYQDTNHAQYRWLQLLAEERRNLMVVGDDAQCLVAGTQVTMADRSRRAIEEVCVGDVVLSGHGAGQFGPSRVMRVHRSERSDGVAITLRSGRRLVSTPQHTHFAGRAPMIKARNLSGPGRVRDISIPHMLMSRERAARADFRTLSTAELEVTLCAGERNGVPVHRLAAKRENGPAFDGLTSDMRRIEEIAAQVGRDDTDTIWLHATARLGADGGELP